MRSVVRVLCVLAVLLILLVPRKRHSGVGARAPRGDSATPVQVGFEFGLRWRESAEVAGGRQHCTRHVL